MGKQNTTYLFYDTETTGLNPCFDQVIQFAAIRTDLELNEIERYEIFIQLNKDVVPSPYACITHRIALAQCQQGQPEVEAIAKIHKLLNKPNTISIGYNTLGFDDEFLRFAFYRNLLPPYTHQYANGCYRMDLYPMLIMYYLYKPELLQWPTRDNKISLKLEDLNQLNQLAPGQAHNAMVDVEATLELAQILRQENAMWDYVAAYFDKKTDMNRIEELGVSFELNDTLMREALFVNGKIGAKNQFIAPVLSLGQHAHYRNQTLWLRLDQAELANTQLDNIPETTFVFRKRLAEQAFLLPILERFRSKVDSERWQLAQHNKAWLQAHPDVLQAIMDYHVQYQYPEITNVDVSAALYHLDFPNAYDEFQWQEFHLANPNEKAKVARQIKKPAYRELAQRIVGRSYLASLNAEEQANFTDYIAWLSHADSAELPLDFRGQARLTPMQAQAEAYRLLQDKSCDEQQQKLLQELREYLAETFALTLTPEQKY